MANVEFPDYMKGVSGTLRTITLGDGTKRKIVVTCSKSGKQRIYFRDYKPRTTKVSEKERAAHALFTKRQAIVKELLSSGQCKSRAEAWRIAKAHV